MYERKGLKDQFEKDYTIVKVVKHSRKGYRIRYLYSAPWYVWALPEENLKKEKKIIGILSSVSLILALAAGAQKTPVNMEGSSVIPALLALCLHMVEIFACTQFLCTGQKTTRMTYKSIDRILGAATGLRGFLLLWTVAAAIKLSLKTGFDMLSMQVVAIYGGCALLAFVILKRFNRIGVYIEKNLTAQRSDEVPLTKGY